MAMTKKEREHLEKVEHDMLAARALSWPQYPVPKPLTRDEVREHLCDKPFGTVMQGWFFNDHSMKVTLGCSTGYGHSMDNPNVTSTQGCGVMYRTEFQAYMAMRHKVTREVADKLLKMDMAMFDAMCREAKDREESNG